ncbi:uncharacterized protein PITG_15572 [Phytophthora infestans T30-4]|uniref:Armadillo repeat-containing protein n=1 Tax=Phytophthora infestans (strain T30-4) TaxID=403677 RepID=D0NT37_PHYIT|nr:uncharacterized protein PITG_15572 [Phytophthora infestans T30-4]EEY64793.1 conserved hypothetical protein [Phytophthora infestans T30-4]|eukprot:XP_002897720.1 conserved hypothetical protein [Phytophthora infestans T30-4]
MDASIARGGISHVLSQARASLKHPSRPFTPQSSSRPLFHGDDYRPGSRPSSSYTAVELEEMAQQKTQQQRTPLVPMPTKLPPRLSGRKARPPATAKRSEKTISASSSSLKLVHAPVLSDDSEDELSSADAQAAAETQFDSESSLSLPSTDELVQSYDDIERCMDDLLDLAESPTFLTKVGQLRGLVDAFVDLSLFLQAGSKDRSVRDPEDAAAANLRGQLFHKLSDVLLENWATKAECVLELAPSLLALYCSCSDDNAETSAQVVKLGKALFVLSKDSGNDGSFCNVRYVEAVLHAIADTGDQSSEHEDDRHSEDSDVPFILPSGQRKIPMKALIYAAGTLKNCSNAEDKMARLLATNRAIAILSETILWRSDDVVRNKEIAQFLIQTTGILRNLSVTKSNHKQFLEARIPLRLCGMIPALLNHQELMVNVSRILSKLTLHELPRAQINQNSSNLQNLMALIDHRQNSWLSLTDPQRPDMRFQDLLFVRVFFILGNLCAGNDQNRRLIATNSGVSIMLEVLQFYAARYSDARNAERTDEKEERRCATEGEQAMEVLIKLVRVVANLAINADVGAQLNGYEALSPLLEVLEVSQRVEDEELMLNTVSCITNVSYYSTESVSGSREPVQKDDYCFIESNRVAITQLLSRILLDRNEEAVVEAARAFGNLSRFKDVLGYMSELKVLDCLVVLLDHSSREVVYTVCGVLMNAALDQKTRQSLLSVRPMGENEDVDVRSLLVGIVKCAAVDDLDMTLIASKALYNLLLSQDVKAGDSVDNFTSDAMSLRRTIEEVLEAIDNNQLHELRLVLPQLLRSVNYIINAM